MRNRINASAHMWAIHEHQRTAASLGAEVPARYVLRSLVEKLDRPSCVAKPEVLAAFSEADIELSMANTCAEAEDALDADNLDAELDAYASEGPGHSCVWTMRADDAPMGMGRVARSVWGVL